ncbi:DNA gyrase inhibitor YacG [Paracoccus caeni]|uniref:DNA gyrase inhibitor YacG n=1 Tax=Paracoccus caeni TaxID=657651 RepID=A0A934SGB6_9RHOB|nr:DNA gyrase inhibitor YacG [Paracoccus caeni]MBK4217347.1 DNA gyrase inhibitor YacG [Paracoccus caeni]
MACPICGKPGAEKYRPFCSKRCADIDLGRWLKGSYVIPGTPLDDISSDEDERGRKNGV